MTASPSLDTGSRVLDALGWPDHGALTAAATRATVDKRLRAVPSLERAGRVEVTVSAVWVEDPDRPHGWMRVEQMPVVRLTGRGRAAVGRLADPFPGPAVRAGSRP